MANAELKPRLLKPDKPNIVPDPICTGAPYPRFEPGEYDARCLAARIYQDPGFKAWKCRLEYELFPMCERVFGFFNLGRADKPCAGRRSEYRRVWIIANGDQPKNRQRLSSRVFEGKIFRVRIDDTVKRSDGRDHAPAEVYSTVKEILNRTFP
jgi:hypothetical protein